MHGSVSKRSVNDLRSGGNSNVVLFHLRLNWKEVEAFCSREKAKKLPAAKATSHESVTASLSKAIQFAIE